MPTIQTCPVCSSANIAFETSGPTTRKIDKRSWTIFKCKQCSHGFMNPRPSWDELSFYYSSDYAPYDVNHGCQDMDEIVIKDARLAGEFRHIPIQVNARLLDIGCGGGYFLRIMRELGFQTKGIEPSPSGAESAKRSGLDVFQGTLEEFVISKGSEKFDVITLSHVLEHVPEPLQTLQLMQPLLEPNGYIWIAVPNGGCVWAKTLGTAWHSTDVPYHLQHFTCDSMKKAATIAGFQIIDFKTHSMQSAVAASIRQYLRMRYFIPWKISGMLHVINSVIANRTSRKMDANCSGEAILMRLALR